jgi:hypothetical protein
LESFGLEARIAKALRGGECQVIFQRRIGTATKDTHNDFFDMTATAMDAYVSITGQPRLVKETNVDIQFGTSETNIIIEAKCTNGADNKSERHSQPVTLRRTGDLLELFFADKTNIAEEIGNSLAEERAFRTTNSNGDPLESQWPHSIKTANLYLLTPNRFVHS